MPKLTPSWRNVLTVLADHPDEYVPACALPDGNGRNGCVSGLKLKQMLEAGVIEYGRRCATGVYGYRLTDAGRLAPLPAPPAKEGR